jgi:hypothetical protein
LTVPPVKVVNKIKVTASNWYRKKRIRKSRSSKIKMKEPQCTQQQSIFQSDSLSSSPRTNPFKEAAIRLDGTQNSDQPTQSYSVQRQLPPITGTANI